VTIGATWDRRPDARPSDFCPLARPKPRTSSALLYADTQWSEGRHHARGDWSAYEAHRIDILAGEARDPAFLALNPNGKIPAIYDPTGPSGRPLALFESGAILLYLADKTGQLLSADPNARYETIQWVMWQMGGVGPMFGQVGFFNKFAGKDYEDKRPRDRYVAESARLLDVLENRLVGRDWVMGREYSIADISLLGWVRNLVGFYEARELVEFDRFPLVQAWLERGLNRPAVQRGLEVTAT